MIPRFNFAEAIAWQRSLAMGVVFAGALSIILILDRTGYPFPSSRAAVFEYLVRHQDIAGSVLLVCIAIGAYAPGTRSTVAQWTEWLGRHPWRVAAATFAALCAAMFIIVHNHPLAGDEHLVLFQSRAFAAGHLTGEFPPDLLFRLIPAQYQWRWLVAAETSGKVAVIYWPGFSLLLAPFSLIGAPWICNPLLAALSLVLLSRIAARLTGSDQAGGWAMLFALASPQFTAMALSYFSMSAHLFLNLAFVRLLIEPGRRRLFAAGVVGSFAAVQSNPVPHLLFALPWVASIARRPESRRDLAALLAGYAPLSLLLGFGWWLFLRQLQQDVTLLPYAPDGEPLHRLANWLWYLLLEFRQVFALPGEATVTSRILEQIRLWAWAMPGLPLLAIAGWWLRRDLAPVRLLGLSLICTLLGYLFVGFDQGYGWGARYVHPAWGALPVLGAIAMLQAPEAAQLRSYVARLAVLSLICATALRLFQIRLFIDEQLSLRPPLERAVRQIVFINPNPVFYTQDFLQNDPFLRDPVIFMMSRGRNRDYDEVIRRRFPGARLAYDGVNGQVWRLQ